MTAKLFVALYVSLFVGMWILFFTNFPVAWVLFAFLFVAVFGGLWFFNRPYLIAAAFLVPSLIVLGAGLLSILQAREIGAWPTARGVITRSWYCTQTTNGRETYTGPCIEYSYQVDELTYHGDSTDTGEFSAFVWPSPLERFKVDWPVQVHYDPRNPGISRLTAEITSSNWVTIGIGGIMAVLSAFTLFWTLFGPKRTPQTNPGARLTEGRPVPPPDRPAPRRDSRAPATPDMAEQLEKLAELHEKQEITEEEYAAAKKRLLGLP